ncbi:hypothetical protein KIH74_27805 [Kineosporia sp. J2-2]|uniref:Uncharacterized protein n=1 Tax=Kineosporia corallincola TaxID=2835133 RepID=A0ABS5TNW1_9ACTN|nr:hypothetical protein [Kineosporia corallincola]MBT0772782.1 hypothetical protein [Kineosporia corallincola]
MAQTHAQGFPRFSRFSLFSGRIGDDGLTRRERRRLAREYMNTAGRKSSQAEMDALEARLKARLEKESRNTEA